MGIWVRRVTALALCAAAVLGVASLARAGASSSPRWIDQNVSFRAGGVTVYATYRHPVGAATPLPAVVLIAGSGPTDRNGNSTVEPGPIDTLKTLANWLSQDGVASLRYDKLGSGQTGLGPYASGLDTIGIKPFNQEAAAALRFLAAEKGVNPERLGVFGHSEGALFALLLATGHAGNVPAIHALGLFEPLSLRYLNLITVQVDDQVAAQVHSGAITKQLAATVEHTLARAIRQLRATGTVAAKLPYGLASLLSPATAKFLSEADRFDPATLAESLPSHTPVLVTCSDADQQVSCDEVDRVVKGLAQADADATFVKLHGVDHVLKVDPTGAATNYTKKLSFSPVLKRALRTFVDSALK
jgi:pimeloyl-ACP methyl ester carboxylesterase